MTDAEFMAKATLDAMHTIWADALNGTPWPEGICAPVTQELYERTLELVRSEPDPERDSDG